MHDVPGVHWHEPTAGRRAGFGKFGRPKTPYDLFMEQEGIPVFRDIGVRRVQDLPLAAWRRMGGRGTYKKAHAHGPGAHVIVLSGEGYSLMWPEGDEPKRYDWEVGTMIVPPNMWFHQHFNAGTTPARYLAFKHEGVAIRNAQGVPKAWISRRAGGDQIDYADEKPVVRTIFAQELARRGLAPKMDQAYAAELAELPSVQAKSA